MGTTSLKRSKHAEVPCSPGCCGPRRGYVREGPVDFVQGLPREEVLREGEHPQVQHLECQQEDGGGTQRWGSRVATNSGPQRVSHSESSLESAMAQVGYSISVAIHVGSSFQHYSGGIFSDPQCQYGQLNHGVLAVGYDHGSNWIV